MFSEVEIKNDIILHYQPWKLKDPTLITLHRMTGITNATFKAQIQGDKQAIIYRRFGESQENVFLSRSQETHIYAQMSASGDGPKIFYYDQKFRLQEFIDSTVLQAKYMLQPGYLQQVAWSLAHFHKSKPQSPFISKENLFRKSFLNQKQKLLKICQTKLAKDIYDQSQKQIVEVLKTWVTQQQLNFLQRLMFKYGQEWEMVFSHNDLLANNILIRKDNKKFIFIDFEYATYNFDFYDIANYFEESSINYQVSKPPYFDFINPSEEAKTLKQRFIDAYVVAKDYSLEDFRLNFDKVRKEEKYVKESTRLSNKVGLGRLLCSLVWGWWSIIVSKNPNINFDYIKFAQWRYNNYQQQKKKLSM